MTRCIGLAFLGVAMFLATGCTHTQLRYNAVHQGNSINEIFEKQVLNNLALFSVNPHAIPSFAVPDSGSTNVTDSGSIAGQESNALFSKFLTPSIGRENYGQWNLVPVHDSRRLALMQCAFQQSIGATDGNCNDCFELDRQFRGMSREEYVCNAPCSIQCGWVCTSNSWSNVPKSCCRLYGYYCGTYAWVEPGQEAHFSNLVLRVIDYAMSDFHEEAQPTKLVTFYIDKYGKAAKREDAYGEVTAEIAQEDPAASILRPAELDAEQLNNKSNSKMTPLTRRVPKQESGISPQQLLQLQQRLRGITPPAPPR